MTSEIAPWGFVVDTDEYAGNFERDLVAYMTGQVGECEVGEECAEKYREAGLKEDVYVISQPDDHGCMRPASIFPNPDWWNDGKGNHKRWSEAAPKGKTWPAYYSVVAWLGKRPPEKTLALWAARAKEFSLNPQACGCNQFVPKFNITGVRLIEQKVQIVSHPVKIR